MRAQWFIAREGIVIALRSTLVYIHTYLTYTISYSIDPPSHCACARRSSKENHDFAAFCYVRLGRLHDNNQGTHVCDL